MAELNEAICLICVHYSNNKWGRGKCAVSVNSIKSIFNDWWCHEWEIGINLKPLAVILVEEDHQQKLDKHFGRA